MATFTFNRDDADTFGRVDVPMPRDRALPGTIFPGAPITLTDATTGDLYIAEVLDYHDGWTHGGEPTFVWAELG